MGFLDLFKKKHEPKLSSEMISIEITEQGFTINGTVVEIPCHIDTLKTLLGKPREVVYQTPRSQIPSQMLAQFPELAAKRINYTWDSLGIYCYTNANSVVNCIGVQRRVRLQVNHTPKAMFAGTITIMGEPWYQAVRQGEDMEVHRRIVVGHYSVVSEYADFSAVESTGTEADYSGIEVQLAKG